MEWFRRSRSSEFRAVVLIPLGERHLRLAISEFVEHYHLERDHQGRDHHRLITRPLCPANDNAPWRAENASVGC